MSSQIGSIIADVEAAVGSADAPRRRTMLRGVTDLLAAEVTRLNRQQVAAFDAVMVRLVQGAQADARAELAQRLADLDDAPPMIVRDLAFDQRAEIAGLLLERSPQLSEHDLLHLAERRGQAHLLALARRPALTKQLADILVQRGGRHVARTVAAKEGVFLSERAYAVLMRRAASDPVLCADLAKRSDVAPNDRKRLTLLAKEQADQMLNQAFGLSVQEALIAENAGA